MNSHTSDRTEQPGKMSPEKQALLAQRLAGALPPAKDDLIPRRSGTGPAPLSFAQQRLWVLDRLEPGGSTYNVPYAYRFAGSLTLDALQRALTEIVARHEVLRTRVRMEDGVPVQVIDPPSRVELQVRDMSALPGRESLLRSFAFEESRRPFDLERGPLMRVAVVRLATTDHVVFLTFHHVIFDGWSEGVFFRELQTLYGAFVANEASTLPPLPVQYADFALWQHNWLRGEVLERQLAFWRERLGGELPLLEIPGDHPRPPTQTFRGKTRLFTLDTDLHGRLLRLSQAEGTTLYMTTLAAFAVLLWRYTGQSDIIVGTPIAGRTRRETEGMVGFFVNTLVIRTDLKGNPSFRELLKRVRESTLGAFDHQDVPFEKIVEELHPQRVSTHNPLFQVMFVLQTAPKGEPLLPGVSFVKMETDTETAKFDLTLSLTEKEGGLAGWLEGSADIFEQATLTRMSDHYEALLRGIAGDPSRPIGALPVMTDREYSQVVVDWNESRVDYPRDSAIHREFEEQVRRRPGAPALVCEGQRLSYDELNRKANKLARFLRGRGIDKETLVGISVARSPEMIVAILGVLKAGGAYLPLDPAYPEERLRLLLEEARVPLILTTDSAKGAIPPHAAEIVRLDADRAAIEREEDHDLPLAPGGGSPAYVMYTSGSTGRPKGVIVPHRAVLRLVKGARYAHFGPEEVFLHLSPASFDASTFEVWGALLNGATLVVAPPETLSLEALGSLIRKSGVTTLWLTASLFHQMVDGPIECFAGVRQLLAGGDVLSVAHVSRFISRHPGCRLINGYGPTENTTFTCCFPVKGTDRFGGSVPIGRPVENTLVFILDEYLLPVPVGVPGELYAGGDGLALGYLGRPELTAEKFIRSPFGAAEGDRLYRTGDRARYLPDGNIEFLGRGDTQVKLRGFRIEMGEIETVLCEHTSVAEAVAVVREYAPGDRRLVAYCVPKAGRSAAEGELRSFLVSRLPAYMIPSAFVFLNTLPTGRTGKVDRSALPAPGPGSMEGEGVGADASATPAERALAGIWTDTLGVPSVPFDRSFFELGGHSLLAMKVISRIREVFRIDLPLLSLFEHPTVRELAMIIEAKLTEEIEGMSDEEASRQTE